MDVQSKSLAEQERYPFKEVVNSISLKKKVHYNLWHQLKK